MDGVGGGEGMSGRAVMTREIFFYSSLVKVRKSENRLIQILTDTHKDDLNKPAKFYGQGSESGHVLVILKTLSYETKDSSGLSHILDLLAHALHR